MEEKGGKNCDCFVKKEEKKYNTAEQRKFLFASFFLSFILSFLSFLYTHPCTYINTHTHTTPYAFLFSFSYFFTSADTFLHPLLFFVRCFRCFSPEGPLPLFLLSPPLRRCGLLLLLLTRRLLHVRDWMFRHFVSENLFGGGSVGCVLGVDIDGRQRACLCFQVGVQDLGVEVASWTQQRGDSVGVHLQDRKHMLTILPPLIAPPVPVTK